MRRRIQLWRWQWTWRKRTARDVKAHGASLGLTPRPPYEHSEGETVWDFARRVAALHTSYADQARRQDSVCGSGVLASATRNVRGTSGPLAADEVRRAGRQRLQRYP